LAISNRLPKPAQIAALYALIVFAIYSWTLLWFFYRLPSWFFYLSIGEILTNLAYSLATNFFESAVVMAIPVLLAIILPKKWFFDLFVARGAVLLLPGLGYMMYVAFQFRTKLDYPSAVLNWYPIVLAVIILLAFLVGRVGFLCRAIETLGDHAIVFLYLSIPASLVSIVVILFRLLV